MSKLCRSCDCAAQVVYIIVLIGDDGGAAQAAAVDDAGVVECIAENDVAFAHQRRNHSTVAVNIDQARAGTGDVLILEDDDGPPDPPSEAILTEVMLFFEQASRKPGRERGRTGDRGVVPDVSSKSLPIYFRKSVQSLKDQMIRGQINPLTNNAFMVDVYVHRDEAGEPKAYYVTTVHRIVPLG